jgi:hypothetical protein
MLPAPYHEDMLQPDGSIRIAWYNERFDAVVVRARFRPREELDAFAREVADVALLERLLPDLRTALRKRFPGEFDLMTQESMSAPWQVVVSFHPPRGDPNPDPW